ncbi:MAG: hypothetical protein ABI658_20540, partial [Acidimicrobiales bacterium]
MPTSRVPHRDPQRLDAYQFSLSGQNDTPDPNDPFEGRVQSFGQIVKLVGPIGGVPGFECRGYPSTGG